MTTTGMGSEVAKEKRFRAGSDRRGPGELGQEW